MRSRKKRRYLEPLIRCELCGETFQNLTTHLIKIHQVSPEDYRHEFDVDHMMSKELRARLSRAKSTKRKAPGKEYVPLSKGEMLQELKQLARKHPEMSTFSIRFFHPPLCGQIMNAFGQLGVAFRAAGLDARVHHKWTKEEVAERIVDRARRDQSISAKDVLDTDHNLWAAGMRQFGSWGAAVEAAGFDYAAVLKRHDFTDEELAAEAKAWVKRHGPLEWVALDKTHPNLPDVIRKRFGSLEEAARQWGLPFQRRCEQWSKERVFEYIRERESTGKSLQTKRVCAEHAQLHWAARKLFGTWAKALREGGIDPAKHGVHDRLTKDEVKRALREWHKTHGELTHKKLARTDYLLSRRVNHRFGSLKNAAKACGIPFKAPPKGGYQGHGKWTPERVLKEIRKCKSFERIAVRNPPLYGAAYRLFGSWQKAVKAAGCG